MRTSIALLLLASALAAKPAENQPSEKEGLVLAILGRWTRGSDEVHFGQNVRDATLNTSRDGSIAINCKQGPVSYHCEQRSCTIRYAEICKSPSAFAKALGPLAAAVAPLISQHPEHFVSAVSRGLGPDVQEAVVQLQGDQLDLSPVFRAMPAAAYRFRLEPVARQSEPRVVQWAQGTSSPVSIRGLQPGLYRVILVDPAGESTGSEAWILASSPRHYPRLAADFDQARQAAAKLAEEVDADSARALLRAYLEALSDQRTK